MISLGTLVLNSRAVCNHWTGLDWSGLNYWTPSRIEQLTLCNILGFTDAIT